MSAETASVLNAPELGPSEDNSCVKPDEAAMPPVWICGACGSPYPDFQVAELELPRPDFAAQFRAISDSFLESRWEAGVYVSNIELPLCFQHLPWKSHVISTGENLPSTTLEEGPDSPIWQCRTCAAKAPSTPVPSVETRLSRFELFSEAIAMATEELHKANADVFGSTLQREDLFGPLRVSLGFERLHSTVDLIREVAAAARRDIEPRTTFQRRGEIRGKAPYWNETRNLVLAINTKLPGVWKPALQPYGSDQPYVPSIEEIVRVAVEEIKLLDACFGSFDVWMRRPRLATLQALLLALQNAESDAEEFLRDVRERELAMPGVDNEALLAQVLLGLRLSDRSITFRGDLTVRRRSGEINLDDLTEHEIYEEVLRAVRRQAWVYKHDGQIDSDGRLMHENAYIDPLYPDSSPLDRASYLAAISPDIQIERDWEQITKMAGLKPQQRKALLLRKHGLITSRSSINEWKRSQRVITKKRSELEKAIDAATRKRVIAAPVLSAANSFVRRCGSGFSFVDNDLEWTAKRTVPEPKWFQVVPPPIAPRERKTKYLFKKVSTLRSHI
jgi:hypothetical protein